MKLRGVCVCTNESDVIQDSLRHAAQFCDEVYVYDLGSTDGTVELVREIEDDKIRLFDSVKLPFHEARHADVWFSLWAERPSDFGPDDWYMIIDSDEFLIRDPRPTLSSFAYRFCDKQLVAKVDGVFTDDDYRAWESGDRRGCLERLHHVRLNDCEPLFFRCGPNPEWPRERDAFYKIGCKIPPQCRRSGWTIMLTRHFPYRSPEQIERRLRTRAHNEDGGGIMLPQWMAQNAERDARGKGSRCFVWNDRRYVSNFPLPDLTRYLTWTARAQAATLLRTVCPALRGVRPTAWLKQRKRARQK